MKKLDAETHSIRQLSTKLLGAAAITALSLGLGVLPAAADGGRGCSNASLQGDYKYEINATSLTVPPLGPLAILGKITLDGNGGLAGSINGSIAGDILPNVPITGTYSIASDCTGTFTTAYPLFTAHFSLMLVEAGEGRRRAELLAIDAGTVGTGSIKPIRRE